MLRSLLAKLTSPAATLLIAASFLTISFWVLAEQLRTTTPGAIWQAAVAQPWNHIALSLAFTGVSFACQALYDFFAVRVVAPGTMNPARPLFAGFAANAIANTLGFHVITASAVRYRIYSRAGLAIGDVLRVISLSSLAIGLSYVAVLAVAFLLAPVAGHPAHISTPQSFAIGLVLAATLIGLVTWLSGAHRSASIARFKIEFPGAWIAAIQLVIGVVEMGAAIGALYVLIPMAPPFVPFTIAVVIAVAVGVVSHTPGAVGVFEATTILLLGGESGPALFAALLVYRVIYNIVPFAVAAAAMGLYEVATASITGNKR